METDITKTLKNKIFYLKSKQIFVLHTCKINVLPARPGKRPTMPLRKKENQDFIIIENYSLLHK
jgi:hypothetical protein